MAEAIRSLWTTLGLHLEQFVVVLIGAFLPHLRFLSIQKRLRSGDDKLSQYADPMPRPHKVARELSLLKSPDLGRFLTGSRIAFSVVLMTASLVVAVVIGWATHWLVMPIVILSHTTIVGIYWYQWICVDLGLMRGRWGWMLRDTPGSQVG